MVSNLSVSKFHRFPFGIEGPLQGRRRVPALADGVSGDPSWDFSPLSPPEPAAGAPSRRRHSEVVESSRFRLPTVVPERVIVGVLDATFQRLVHQDEPLRHAAPDPTVDETDQHPPERLRLDDLRPASVVEWG